MLKSAFAEPVLVREESWADPPGFFIPLRCIQNDILSCSGCHKKLVGDAIFRLVTLAKMHNWGLKMAKG